LQWKSAEVPLLLYPEPNKTVLRATEMKKYLKFILPAVLILLVCFVLLKSKAGNRDLSSFKGQSFANLKIDIKGNSSSYDISNFVGKTALEATDVKTTVVTNGTGINAFVTSINGRNADTKKREFWEFDVNGKEALVGAGSYTLNNHDEIEWKITSY
jgi:hypothetical protein